jgi:magnesium chelatase family protein
MSKISGPLLDRIDIHVEVPPVDPSKIKTTSSGEDSKTIREKVFRARGIQSERFKGRKIYCNSQMTTKDIQKFCVLDDESEGMLQLAMKDMGLSARAHDKVLRIARTIADLDGKSNIQLEHVSEALQYRVLDRDVIV